MLFFTAKNVHILITFEYILSKRCRSKKNEITIVFFACFRSVLPENVTECQNYAYLEDIYDILTKNPGKLNNKP